MKLAQITLIFLWSTCAGMATAADLNAPPTIQFNHDEYRTAFQRVGKNQGIWEYTTDDEKVEEWEWTRLITTNHLPTGSITAAQLMDATKGQLESMHPTPPLPLPDRGQHRNRIDNLSAGCFQADV